jgi:hypothetical protein
VIRVSFVFRFSLACRVTAAGLALVALPDGNVEARWAIERVLETGDRATGVPALHELYDRMKATPVSSDLQDLWRKLGVRGQGEGLVLDDSAPLGQVRRAILRGPGRST